MFTLIIENLLPINFYSELSGMITDCIIMKMLIKKYLPELYKFLIETHSFDNSLDNFIYKWFITIFAQNFNKEFTYLIWDFIIMDGNIILFKAVLAILKIMKNEILLQNSFGNVILIF